MSVAEFAYAQARIGARHGERLRDADWKALESAQSLSRYLELARTTALKQFLGQVSPDISTHAVERVLRREAALYAMEVAAWAPQRWRPAFAWIAALPLVPLLGETGEGAWSSAWMAGDSTPGPLSELGPDAPDAIIWRLARLVDGGPPPPEVGRRWLRRWRALWPKGDPGVADLGRLVSASLRALTPVDELQQGGGSFRFEFARTLTRFFRSHVTSPIALVCHVGLVLVDIERLRGGLVRRSLFGGEEERIAA